ncbi:MAG: chemotaxis protein CheW [Bacteroidales bacterium]|nr:chemotaxis protein CheW [Bacteroidales bacterium]
MQVAIFRVNTREFGIPIEYLKTILKAGYVYSVPLSSQEKLGLINFQGEILTVFHPGIMFDNKKMESREENVILILKLSRELESWNVGLFVDHIEDIINVDEDEMIDFPEETDINREFVHKSIPYLDKYVWLLNIEKMLLFNE